MKTSFTPGPWHINSGDPCVIDSVNASNPISFVAMTLPSPELDWNMTAEAEANARLIKTAPELFEALQAAMFYVPVETKARVLGDLAIDKALGYDKDKGYMP
jgi:hypothetical protein